MMPQYAQPPQHGTPGQQHGMQPHMQPNVVMQQLMPNGMQRQMQGIPGMQPGFTGMQGGQMVIGSPSVVQHMSPAMANQHAPGMMMAQNLTQVSGIASTHLCSLIANT